MQDICPGFDDALDSDFDGVPNGCDPCIGADNIDRDGDGVCDSLDECPLGLDSDGDGVCDSHDICPGADDFDDDDDDLIPNARDLCFGVDNIDTDGDGICDSVDDCPRGVDSDGDGVCDANDVCPGLDDQGGADDDEDGIRNECDPCVGPDNVDRDFDGICDSVDVCPDGNNNTDTDNDGVPDGCDPCMGPDNLDADGDGFCDSLDVCRNGPDDIDSDGDGIMDGCDLCYGADDTGDSDGDRVCDDLDACPGSDDTRDCPLPLGVICVRINASGSQDGSSWYNAYPTLEAALERTAADPTVDQIWLAPGSYPGTFELPGTVGLFGGFAGNERELSGRSLDASAAMLGTVCVTTTPGPSDLDRLTIQNLDAHSVGRLVVHNCHLKGGAISATTVTFNACAILRSVSVNLGSSFIFDNCDVVDDPLNDPGFGGRVRLSSSTGLIKDCRFEGRSSGREAVLRLLGSTQAEVIRSRFINNRGAISASADSAVTLAECLFCGNHTLRTIELDGTARAAIAGCTFANNRGAVTGTADTSATVSNCLLWNAQPDFAGEFNGEFTANLLRAPLPAGAIDLGGNIVANPRFADPNGPDNDPLTFDDNDYSLSENSPAIDAGSNDAIPRDFADLDGDGDANEPTPFDLAGGPRVLDDAGMPDSGSGVAPIVDIGAYEFAGYTCAGDITGDDLVALDDLAVLLAVFGAQAGDPLFDLAADVTNDGEVGLPDLAVLLAAYATACP